MLVDMRFEQIDGVTVVTLSGDVDMSNASEVGSGLLRAVANDTLAVVLDLSEVDYFDSAGIRLLYDLRERLRVRGQALRIVVPPRSPARDALEMAAVLRSIDVDATADEALAAALESVSAPGTFPEGGNG